MSDDFTLDPSDGPAVQEIRKLQAQLQAQAELIETQQRQLAHGRKIFERASEAARIGVWECDLADASLQWTDVVYDIFDLPRGTPLCRNEILACYRDEDAQLLEQMRSAAIANCAGFKLDTRIVTAKGNERWIRITASVESENGVPLRIFGMKQDITDEKIMSDRMKFLAECDVLTGLANRTRFQQELARFEENADGTRNGGALMLIDLDEFKSINDNFGHPAGDECLRQTALRLRAACGPADLIARIGGDEFAILLGPGLSPVSLQQVARQVVEMLRAPIRFGQHQFPMSASVGVAQLGPSTTISEWYTNADAALYAAKKAGRNTFRVCQLSSAGWLRPVETTARAVGRK